MRILKDIHSCLLIEKAGTRLLFDQGKFSFVEGLIKPEQFQDLSAIILMHQHPDHIDDAALKQIVAHNPAAKVIANTQIQTRLETLGITCEVFEEGEQQLGEFKLSARVAAHAPLLNAEKPQNVAYLVDDTLLHPGDSFAQSLDAFQGTQVLALPIMAPWATELETVEFALRLAPRQIIPIHDGYAKDFFREQRYENFQSYLASQSIAFWRPRLPGEALEL